MTAGAETTPGGDDNAALLLYGVFRTLITHHLPLSVADYLDAVRVLESELRREDLMSVLTRGRLRRVCEILWTRSPEEARLLHRIFDGIEPPTKEAVEEIISRVEATPSGDNSSGEDGLLPDGNIKGMSNGYAAPPDDAARAAISFDSAGLATGVPLPPAVVRPGTDAAWVLQPQTVMSARALAILWRRYRRMTRVGQRTELDLDATVASYVGRGVLDRPAYRARRANVARLLILADASPSMAPWLPFLSTLAESLRLGGLRSSELWYFANLPRQTLFESPWLTTGRPAREVLSRFGKAALLIISDGGAARGARNSFRARQSTEFVREAVRQMRSVVWVNPMPPERWAGTTAAAIAHARGMTTVSLEPVAMIRAVDVLRGTRTS